MRKSLFTLAVFIAALAHGIWLGASWHAAVHTHNEFCVHEDEDECGQDGGHDEPHAHVSAPATHSSICPACQLATAVPVVPVAVCALCAPPLPAHEPPRFYASVIPPSAWLLPFGHGPPSA